MTNHSSRQIQWLRAPNAAFNARDIGAAFALMTTDVTWPKAFNGGFVLGPGEIRAYWAKQVGEIKPHAQQSEFSPANASQVLVDEYVGRRFTLKIDLIQAMEVCPLASTPPA